MDYYPYRAPGSDIYNGGQQFGTLPNPQRFQQSEFDVNQIAPLFQPPQQNSIVNLDDFTPQNQPYPQTGYMDYAPQGELGNVSPVGMDNPDIQAFMMGRFINQANGLDRNMRQRDQRVRQSYGDDQVDRFFSRVVAPIGAGAAGAMGNPMTQGKFNHFQDRLQAGMTRNQQLQAQHINDYQQNITQAFNQQQAIDPANWKRQRDMMRADAYARGIEYRNDYQQGKLGNDGRKIDGQIDHWGRQDSNQSRKTDGQISHWNNQDQNATARTGIYQQNANTNQEYKRGQLQVNQMNAQTKRDLSQEQIAHLGRIDDIANRRLNETIRMDTARIDKLHDDILSGAVKRDVGMAQIDKIYNDMDVKQQKIQFDYDKLTANIVNNEDNRSQRDRMEDGRNERAAAGVTTKDGKQSYKTDEGFRAKYGNPIGSDGKPVPSTPAPRQSGSAKLLEGLARNRPVVSIPQRRPPSQPSNGLVAPPPAMPVGPSARPNPVRALQAWSTLPPERKRTLKAQFIAKYGFDPDVR